MTITGHQESAALQTIRETVDRAAGKVFGEPIQQDGLTVLPVAAVATGGGGGGGSGSAGKGEHKMEAGRGDMGGEGGGFGVLAKPAGAFVIKNGDVSWRPAVNLNRVILGGQVVAVVALVVLRGIMRSRRHDHHHNRGREAMREHRGRQTMRERMHKAQAHRA
jgi:uncharacterized spore protein YtfJ